MSPSVETRSPGIASSEIALSVAQGRAPYEQTGYIRNGKAREPAKSPVPLQVWRNVPRETARRAEERADQPEGRLAALPGHFGSTPEIM